MEVDCLHKIITPQQPQQSPHIVPMSPLMTWTAHSTAWTAPIINSMEKRVRCQVTMSPGPLHTAHSVLFDR